MPKMQQNTFGGSAPPGPAGELSQPSSCNGGLILKEGKEGQEGRKGDFKGSEVKGEKGGPTSKRGRKGGKGGEMG